MTTVNVIELSRQLNDAYSEIERLSNQVIQSETETIRYRKERNDIMDERDELQTSLARHITSIQRLHWHMDVLETELESAASENYHFTTVLAEMLANEQSIACKEMQMESDKERLCNEITILTEKLEGSSTDLLALRQAYVSNFGLLEAELKQKAEDLFIVNANICRLTEAIRMLINERSTLKVELERVQLKLNAKNEEFERQKVEGRQLMNVNDDLTQNVNDLIAERDLRQGELKEIRPKECLERENAALKTTLKDLARQICYLLNEIQTSGREMTSGLNQQQSKEYLSNAKKLVTFKNIEEMQENNKKLLIKVLELSTKVDDMEAMQNHINMQCYDAKISSYKEQLQCAEQSRIADGELLAICLKQKERFKQLYYVVMASFCKTHSNEGIEDNITVTNRLLYISENVPNGTEDNGASKVEKIKLKELEDLEYEYSKYRTGSSDNFKLLNDECNGMQGKMKELISDNYHLSSEVNFANEKIKIQQESIGHYKRLIQMLKERQAFCQQNWKMQKNLERLEFEDGVRMELQLVKVTREYSALRQKLKDEENRFRDDKTSLKRQVDSAVTKMKDEQVQVEILRSKITEERRQIELKNQQSNELSKMLQEALTAHQHNDPMSTLMCDLQASQRNDTNYKSEVEELQSEIRIQLTGSHLKAAEAVKSGDSALNSHLKVNRKEFLEVTTSFYDASSSNVTTQLCKRPRDVKPYSAEEESSSASECASPRKKLTRLGEKKIEGGTAHVPASSQCDENNDEDKDEVELFANDEEREVNENIVWNETNEIQDKTVSFVISIIDDMLHDACRTDEEAISSPHPILGQSNSIIKTANDSYHQEVEEFIGVDLADEGGLDEDKDTNQTEPIIGVSGQAEGIVSQITVTDDENARNTFDDIGASILQVNYGENISIEKDANDAEDVGTDGVSFEENKSSKRVEIEVEVGREGVASINDPQLGIRR